MRLSPQHSCCERSLSSSLQTCCSTALNAFIILIFQTYNRSYERYSRVIGSSFQLLVARLRLGNSDRVSDFAFLLQIADAESLSGVSFSAKSLNRWRQRHSVKPAVHWSRGEKRALPIIGAAQIASRNFPLTEENARTITRCNHEGWTLCSTTGPRFPPIPSLWIN